MNKMVAYTLLALAAVVGFALVGGDVQAQNCPAGGCPVGGVGVAYNSAPSGYEYHESYQSYGCGQAAAGCGGARGARWFPGKLALRAVARPFARTRFAPSRGYGCGGAAGCGAPMARGCGAPGGYGCGG